MPILSVLYYLNLRFYSIYFSNPSRTDSSEIETLYDVLINSIWNKEKYSK
jgi:hypothetical protein